MRLLLSAALLISTPLAASQYDRLIDHAAHRNGVDPIVLRAIAEKETNKRPWTFNCDGEGFYFNTKQQAVNALWGISRNPWMVKIRPSSGKTLRHFFPNQHSANAFLNAYVQTQRHAGLPRVSIRTDDTKQLSAGEARVRQLWVLNVDIGIAQVNYRYHGQNQATVQQWFDPQFNLNYAASLVATHRSAGKSDLEAAGDYHSKTPSVRARYMSALRPIYEREMSRANLSVAGK